MGIIHRYKVEVVRVIIKVYFMEVHKWKKVFMG